MKKIQTVEENKLYIFAGKGRKSGKISCFLNPILKEIGRRYRIAVIVCPGGGYGTILEREADVVALRYQAYGLQAFVLRYSVGAGKYRVAVEELAETIRFIRSNADKWDIDVNKIAVCGFSAGGHVAASLGCYWKQASFLGKPDDIKPNALCLCYPVITAGIYRHEESISNCLADESLRYENVSLELQVDENMPPVFLWHNADDDVVSVLNSILLLQRLSEVKVLYEAHIFPQGGHGLSLCDECTAAIESQIDKVSGQWFELSLQWMRRILK